VRRQPDFTSLPLKRDVQPLIDGAAEMLQWQAADVTQYRHVEDVVWKKFHAMPYDYHVYFDVETSTFKADLTPIDGDTIFVTDVPAGLIGTSHNAMWGIRPLSGNVRGRMYFAMSGKACRRHRWFIPLYEVPP